MPRPLDMAMILEARRALEGRVRRTPIEESRPLSEAAGVPVSLKLESQQLTGSFKIRGAFFRLLALTPEERRAGVVTCSAGNHGRGVAYVARELGIPAEIHVAATVAEERLAGMRALGATVVRSSTDNFFETEEIARAEAGRSGRRWVSASTTT